MADFVGRITEEISNFLDHPVQWTRAPKDDAEAQEATAPIRQSVFRELHSLAIARLFMRTVREIVRSAIEEQGGEMKTI